MTVSNLNKSLKGVVQKILIPYLEIMIKNKNYLGNVPPESSQYIEIESDNNSFYCINLKQGICSNLAYHSCKLLQNKYGMTFYSAKRIESDLYEMISNLGKDWKLYSGCAGYPIPSAMIDMSPTRKYYLSAEQQKSMYSLSERYCQLRWEFMEYLLDCFKQITANN